MRRPLALLVVLFLLPACAGPGSFMGMSPEQLREAVKVKDQDVTCFTGTNAMYGSVTLVLASADRGIYGTVTVNEKCAVSITGDSKAKDIKEPVSMKAVTEPAARPRLAEPAERSGAQP